MRTIRELLGLLGLHYALTVCRLIERLRPGAGHEWLAMSDPPMCRHCGTSRL